MVVGQQLSGFEVFGWSVSGNETCVGVKQKSDFFLFDVGIVPSWAKGAEHVFISHGHIDHIGSICHHMRKRELNRMPPAKYYMLPALIESVKTLCAAYGKMQGSSLQCFQEPLLVPVEPGSTLQINKKWSVRSFVTDHAVPSQGYILYSTDDDLKLTVPVVAFTGDTRFSIFDHLAHPDLLKVKLLIAEATYLDRPEKHLSAAQLHGHIHLQQYAQNADLFHAVEALYFIHFSDRYSARQVVDLVNTTLPEDLLRKTHLCLAAKRAQNLDC
uniref:Nuclear ribonuclease Z n=2 Tax=Schistocephalus solidus TaxID=70667 RepID=A0A0V0JC76_SCHSO